MAASLGWRVDSAASGAEALALTRARLQSGQGPHQVVFADWRMEGMDGWQMLQQLSPLYPSGQEPMAVMVSSFGREQLGRRSEQEQARLSAYLIKPVTTAMLAESVNNAQQGRGNMRATARAPVRPKARLDGMRILLVEDNPLNQLVAVGLLRAEGAEVQTADNGRDGVEAVRTAVRAFDVVLMDMQMPVMDGCTATRAIRETLGITRLPVIAMTANTMQSDRDACLAAGMNDHVGKPFDINYLIEVLHRHTGRAPELLRQQSQAALRDNNPDGNPGSDQGSNQDSGAIEPIQVEQAIRNMGDDRALYTMVLDAYLQELGQFSVELNRNLNAGDRTTALRLLHTLKGTSASVGARSFAAVCLVLEQEIRDPHSTLEDLAHLPQFLAALQLTQQQLANLRTTL